jgi:hypothetical protein
MNGRQHARDGGGATVNKTNNLRDEPQNLSSYITECMSLENVEILLGNASTDRAEKISPKYLLYYFIEIAR